MPVAKPSRLSRSLRTSRRSSGLTFSGCTYSVLKRSALRVCSRAGRRVGRSAGLAQASTAGAASREPGSGGPSRPASPGTQPRCVWRRAAAPGSAQRSAARPSQGAMLAAPLTVLVALLIEDRLRLGLLQRQAEHNLGLGALHRAGWPPRWPARWRRVLGASAGRRRCNLALRSLGRGLAQRSQAGADWPAARRGLGGAVLGLPAGDQRAALAEADG
jgi:hypothetical protein